MGQGDQGSQYQGGVTLRGIDRRAFRRLALDDSLIIELRE